MKSSFERIYLKIDDMSTGQKHIISIYIFSHFPRICPNHSKNIENNPFWVTLITLGVTLLTMGYYLKK